MKARALVWLVLLTAAAWGAEPALIELARYDQGLRPSASAAVDRYDCLASAAFDGQPNTAWRVPAAQLPAWLRAAWPYAVEVHEVSFVPAQDTQLTQVRLEAQTAQACSRSVTRRSRPRGRDRTGST